MLVNMNEIHQESSCELNWNEINTTITTLQSLTDIVDEEKSVVEKDMIVETPEVEKEMVVETSDRESMDTDESEVEISDSEESELNVFNQNVEYIKKIINHHHQSNMSLENVYSIDKSSKNISDSVFVEVMAIGDLIKSTLGRKEKDKILQGNINGKLDVDKLPVTDDETAILSKIIDVSKIQYDEFGDGITSIIVLAIELLREMKNLLAQKIDPQTISTGWDKATSEACTILADFAKNNSSNLEQFKRDLINIARTTLCSKILQENKDRFSKLCVDAVLKLHNKNDLQDIQIIKCLGNNLNDSHIEHGFLLKEHNDINIPKRIENADVLIANILMNIDKKSVSDSSVSVNPIPEETKLESVEKKLMKDNVEKILQHNSQILDGNILSTFDTLNKVRLGKCNLIEDVIIGEDKFMKFSGVAQGEVYTIVLRGATQEILDKVERSIHNTLHVLFQTVKEPRICYGGGASEMLMATAVSQLAEKTLEKKEESLAIESFARALRQLPKIIADNANYDNIEKNIIADMDQLGLLESFHLKRQVIIRAGEAAKMVLHINNIIRAPSSPRQRDRRHH
ncbi:unnamed protein product [Rotaria sp. Silwood1]|nr:unnamed protein product [Rotaria sp. Silwood1]CAF4990402.1 unnamed protein product [Rotaria sp. Silwood1]